MYKISDNKYFYHIPKTSGTSLYMDGNFKYLGDHKFHQHSTINWWETYLKTNFDDIEIYTIVRNPYSRIVSFWRYANRNWSYHNSFVDFLNKENEMDAELSELNAAYDTKTTMTEHLKNRNGEIRTKIYKYETDLEKLGKDLNLKNYPYRNKHLVMPYYDWRNFYNKDLQKLVYDMFYEDFKNFGYEEEIS